MYAVSQALKNPLHLATEGILGRFSVSQENINPQSTLVYKVRVVATAFLSFVALIPSIPFWIVGEVVEICTKQGRDHFKDLVDIGDARRISSLDPSKTQMVGTGLSTFQATSNPNFCKGSAVHDALKDPELGLGKGVDILTQEGRELTIGYLRQMGANTFRFSVEWADVKVNGLDKYAEAAQYFSENGFKLVITLDHWIGDGSVNVFEKPGDEDAFVEFCKQVYINLRPYASHFLTFNEINVDAAQKYVMGDIPPKGAGKFWAAYKFMALKLQAHSKVYDALHALENQRVEAILEGEEDFLPPLQVGLSHQAIVMRSNSRWNLIARIAAFVMTYLFHESFMQRIVNRKSKLDFLGVQYYTRPLLGRKGWSPVDSIAESNRYNPSAWMVEGMRYRFDPQGILPILEEIDSRLNFGNTNNVTPLLVTEIGSAGKIEVERSTAIDSNEARKARYNEIAIRAMRVAQDRGIPLIGALWWTLFDNLEWQHGYDPGTAFGIAARDPETGDHRPTLGSHVLAEAFNRSLQRPEEVEEDAM